MAPTWATASVRIVGGSTAPPLAIDGQVPLVQADVLDPDDPLVDVEFGDPVDEQERVAMRQDPFNRLIVQREGERIHSEFPSIIAVLPWLGKPEPDPTCVTQQSVPASSTRPSEHDLLVTLFDLAHQVTSILDQDELFQKISELLVRVIPHDAFAVYLLDKKRNELRIAYPSGYPPGRGRNRPPEGR